MTIFRFIQGEDPNAINDGFHVWSADAVFAAGTTYMSGGGGAITPFNGPFEPPGIPLRLPVPAGLVFTRITIWWRSNGAAGPNLTFTVRNATTATDVHTASVSGVAGPGLALSEAIAAGPATSLDDEIEVIISDPNPQVNPSDIFVRLDYQRI